MRKLREKKYVTANELGWLIIWTIVFAFIAFVIVTA